MGTRTSRAATRTRFPARVDCGSLARTYVMVTRLPMWLDARRRLHRAEGCRRLVAPADYVPPGTEIRAPSLCRACAPWRARRTRA